MKELFITRSFNFINKHQELDHYNQIKIKYGLEIMYNLFSKLIVIIIISLMLGILKQNVLIMIFYSILRSAGYGIHAKSNKMCWISSISTYIALGYLSKTITFNQVSIILIIVLSIFSFILWAPADTPKKPLIRKSSRIKLKILIIIYSIIEIFILIKFKYLTNPIIFGFILECVAVNPFIYLITNTRRNNYKYYKGV